MTERSNDDREPAGTAGQPLLEVLRNFELVNAVIVATRYFGGVKLGKGGLIRAYRLCARETMKEAAVVTLARMCRMAARAPYEDLGTLLYLISSRNGEVISIDYGREVRVEYDLPLKVRSDFERALLDSTRGKISMEDDKGS